MNQGEDIATARSTRLMLRELSEKDQKHHTYRCCMKRSPSKQFENCGSCSLFILSSHKRALSVPVCKNSGNESEEQRSLPVLRTVMSRNSRQS